MAADTNTMLSEEELQTMTSASSFSKLTTASSAERIATGHTALPAPSSPSSNGADGADGGEVSDPNEVPEIVLAAQHGATDRLRLLLQDQPELAQYMSPDGVTPLHWAAINNRLTACRLLVAAGAVVDAKGGTLQATPLHWAARNGLVYIVDFLIHQGADPLRTDSQGFNALHLGVHSSNVMLVIYLLHYSLPIQTTDPYDRTALHWAAYQGDCLSVEVLLKWGADPGQKDTQGLTALHWAAVRGNRRCIQLLVTRGADVFAQTNDGKTPRMVAQETGTLRAFEDALVLAGRRRDGRQRRIRIARQVAAIIVFLMPYLALGVGFWLFAKLAAVIAVPVTILVLVVSHVALFTFVVADKYPGNTGLAKSPYFAGLFSGTAVYVILTWISVLLPKLSGTAFAVAHLAMGILASVCMVTFSACLRMDPGLVPKSGGVAQQKRVIEELLRTGEYDARHFCVYTFIRKPLRSKYSRFHQRCVARFDHYCPWVYNDVGLRNHRLFLVFILSLAAAIFLFLSLTLYYFDELPSATSDCSVLPDVMCRASDWSPFMLALWWWVVFQAFWLLFLIFVQFYQISSGVTTFEASKIHQFGFGEASDFSNVPRDLAEELAQQRDAEEAVGGTTEFTDAASMVGIAEASAIPPTVQRTCFSSVYRLLGLDQFVATAQDALGSTRRSRRMRKRRPADYGVWQNLRDFFLPLGRFDWFEFERMDPYDKDAGKAMLGGVLVDYYALTEYPMPYQGRSGYESLDQV